MIRPRQAGVRVRGYGVNAIEIKLSDGVTLAVPATLQSITTYVLLEQEGWFEKEMSFLRHWLRPGMTVIDIGANLGVYSVPMSRLVGHTGRVLAHEPGSQARSLLLRSRELNRASNLEVLSSALSDREGEGRLVFGGSSELNALGDHGAGETVAVTTLDRAHFVRGGPPPDFVKIDAEGEEEKIVAGGRELFSKGSPLVMLEVKAGNNTNDRLRSLFPRIGYRLFRQLVGAPILVPDFPQQKLDAFELNLFAAKPDRAQTLSEQGLLVDEFPTWTPSEEDLQSADSFLKDHPFASRIGEAGDAGYRIALASYAAWRRCDRPSTVRCAALALALRGLRAACRRRPKPERLSTLARVAWEAGARSESVNVLKQALQSGPGEITEAFWPAAARFDEIDPKDDVAAWFAGALAEQYEKTRNFSSMFSGASRHLEWLCEQSFSGAEMHRRRALTAASAGLKPLVPRRLCETASDHLNATIWRAGGVPGTVVDWR